MNPETLKPSANSDKKADSGQKQSFKQNFWEWVKVITVALLISLPIRYFVAEPFIVNGASMDPTFSTGQFLIVDRVTYHFEKPGRGDVIIFEYPNNPSVYYIKRIVGLPGETIKIKDGHVSIANEANPKGFRLDETYVIPSHTSYENLETTLSPTQYFVMGDNRGASSDSRVWGPLEEKFIVGRPIIRLLPFTAISIWPGEYSEQ